MRYRWNFLLYFQDLCCKSENLPDEFFTNVENLQIIEDCTFVPGSYDRRSTRLGSDREPKNFIAYLSRLPLQSVDRAPRRDEEKELQPPPHNEPAILKAYPFLKEAHARWMRRQKAARVRRRSVSGHGGQGDRSGAGGEGGSSSSSSSAVNPGPSDFDFEEVLAETREIRQNAEEQAEGTVHYGIAQPGGIWSQRRKGRAVAAVEAYARSDDAKKMCDAFKARKSAYFDVVKYGGVDNCLVLANGWGKRLHEFAETYWIMSGLDEDAFRLQHQIFEENEAFKNLYITGNAKTKARIEKIRALYYPLPGENVEEEGKAGTVIP